MKSKSPVRKKTIYWFYTIPLIITLFSGCRKSEIKNCKEEYNLSFLVKYSPIKHDVLLLSDQKIRQMNEQIKAFQLKKNPGLQENLNKKDHLGIIKNHLRLFNKTLYDKEGNSHRKKEKKNVFFLPLSNIKIFYERDPILFIHQSMMYRLPDHKKYYLKPGWIEFNMNAETSISMNTFGRRLAQYGDFTLVATNFYTGWILNSDIALIPENSIYYKIMYKEKSGKNFKKPSQFLRINSPLFYHPDTKIVTMGTRLFLSKEDDIYFYLFIPQRTPKGIANMKIVRFAKKIYAKYLQRGNLTLTKSNLFHQIYLYKNFPYGWGDDFNGIDCSSMVRNIFRIFGLSLPRNSKDQRLSEIYPKKYTDMSMMSRKEKIHFLKTFKTGNLLFRKNHVMIYTGDQSSFQKSFLPGIFHAFTYCYHKSDSKTHRIPNFQAMHTSLNLLYKNGKTYMDELNGALTLF